MAQIPQSLHSPKEAQRRGLRFVGKVKGAHGLRGELYLLVFSSETSWFDQLTCLHLFYAPTQEWVELPLVSVRPHRKGMIAQTKTLKDRNEAQRYKGSEFFIPEDFLVSEPGEGLYLAELEGFNVIQKGRGFIGKIIGFSSNGVQDLIVVINSKGEFEIPLVDPLIVEIRWNQNEVEMDLPEGLVEYE